jgi:hypothetical protein
LVADNDKNRIAQAKDNKNEVATDDSDENVVVKPRLVVLGTGWYVVVE